METAVPFRYIAEVVVVQTTEQEEGETGRGRPVGDLPLPGCQGQKPVVFNIAWEKSKLKRVSPKEQSSQPPYPVLEDSADERGARGWRWRFGSANLK